VTRPIKPCRNPPGRQSKHAGRALERISRLNLWDKRTAIFHARCDKANSYVEQFFGSWENVGAFDSLVWATADVSIILDSIAGYVARQGGPITATGELLPVLRKGFIAYQNTLRLHLQALAELGRNRQDKTPTLAEYLATRSSTGNGQQAQPEAPESPNETAADAGIEPGVTSGDEEGLG